MIISYNDLRLGLREVLLSVSNSNMPASSNFAWENRKFTVPKYDQWIRETMIPGVERQVASDTLRSVGIMQYDIFWPAFQGTENAEELANQIIATFKPVTKIGPHALVYRAERLAAIVDEKWYQIPVRLTWRAHAITIEGAITDEQGNELLDEDYNLIMEG